MNTTLTKTDFKLTSKDLVPSTAPKRYKEVKARPYKPWPSKEKRS